MLIARNTLVTMVITVSLLLNYANAQEFPHSGINPAPQALNKAKKKLSDLSALNPTKIVNGVMFFSKSQKIDTALKSIQPFDVKVKGFRHGTPFSSGGYKLGPNETIKEAIKRYQRDHILFLKQDEKLTKKIINSTRENRYMTESHITAKEAAKNRLANIQKRKRRYIEHGLRIIGIEVKGTAADINRVWEQRSKAIKIIKVKDRGLPVPNKF